MILRTFDSITRLNCYIIHYYIQLMTLGGITLIIEFAAGRPDRQQLMEKYNKIFTDVVCIPVITRFHTVLALNACTSKVNKLSKCFFSQIAMFSRLIPSKTFTEGPQEMKNEMSHKL